MYNLLYNKGWASPGGPWTGAPTWFPSTNFSQNTCATSPFTIRQVLNHAIAPKPKPRLQKLWKVKRISCAQDVTNCVELNLYYDPRI